MKFSRIQNDPFLVAWVGFIAIWFLIAIPVSLIASTGYLGYIVTIILLIVIGFFLFREFIQYYILHKRGLEIKQERRKGFSAQKPFLTAWLGFFVVSLIPTLLIRFLINSLVSFALLFLIQLILWTVVNFFIFKFMVTRHVVPIATKIPTEDLTIEE